MTRRDARRIGRTIDQIVKLSEHAGLDVEIGVTDDDSDADKTAKLDAAHAKIEHILSVSVRLLAIATECKFTEIQTALAADIKHLHELRAEILSMRT